MLPSSDVTMTDEKAVSVKTQQSVLWHVKFTYALISVIIVCQILSGLYFYNYLQTLDVECGIVHTIRVKRQTADLFGENSVSGFEDRKSLSKPVNNKKLTERPRNSTKIFQEDDEGMIIIGHSTRIPVRTFTSLNLTKCHFLDVNFILH